MLNVGEVIKEYERRGEVPAMMTQGERRVGGTAAGEPSVSVGPKRTGNQRGRKKQNVEFNNDFHGIEGTINGIFNSARKAILPRVGGEKYSRNVF